MMMEYARIFTNGGSQAVRLPKSCRFEEAEVIVNRIGNVVMLTPKSDPWASTLQGLSMFTDDFLADGIEELPLQERSPL